MLGGRGKEKKVLTKNILGCFLAVNLTKNGCNLSDKEQISREIFLRRESH